MGTRPTTEKLPEVTPDVAAPEPLAANPLARTAGDFENVRDQVVTSDTTYSELADTSSHIGSRQSVSLNYASRIHNNATLSAARAKLLGQG